ncbi:RPRD1A isoform 2 [Pongo abelii]|uniref:RPRD1A isoform 2 n=1 Tax=Pongo abelii TaxID=9601 RepID=A0A2J8XFK2_PONAB|nr:RPRD1A isoform 2 [Pongo abelii]
MSAFSEAALEKKLSELSNSQQSVQTLSLWLIHHRKHSRPIVTVWERELRKERVSVWRDKPQGLYEDQNDIQFS